MNDVASHKIKDSDFEYFSKIYREHEISFNDTKLHNRFVDSNINAYDQWNALCRSNSDVRAGIEAHEWWCWSLVDWRVLPLRLSLDPSESGNPSLRNGHRETNTSMSTVIPRNPHQEMTNLGFLYFENSTAFIS